jgi:DNA invertase Pin-like site-specific DNA recombinase
MPPIRLVAYYRMSSNPQEKSIPQQRAEMLPRCQLEGAVVVKDFQDQGKSGGSMRKRDAFLAMVAFCQEQHAAGTPIDGVMCYDTSRFSRASSIKTSRYVDELMDAGVYRLLTWERWFDFRKEEDRAIFNLQQDFTSNRYLRDLSARVLRGKKDVASAGFFTGGTVPYGFDRVLVDDHGEEVQRFRRGEKVRLRKQGWREVLSPIPEDDLDPGRQLERQSVLWLLDTFARQEVSYRWLAEQLNLRDVPAPGLSYNRTRVPATDPRRWNVPAVKRILTNPVYKGVARTGASGTGQYHRLVKGVIEAVNPGAGRTTNVEGLILAPLDHGGYVEVDLWDSIQEKVKQRESQKMRPRASDYILPGGILYCGHCGHRMYGCHMKPRRGKKVYDYRKYVCSAPNVKPGTCKHYSIDEETIVGILREQLLTVYLNPERLDGLEAALVAQAEARHDRAPADVDRLKARLAAAEEDIVKARRRTLQAKDDATFAELNEGLRDMLEQRKRLEAELKAAGERTAAPAEDFTGKIADAMKRVRQLRKRVENARGRDLGEAIRLLVSRADLYFEEETNGGRRWYSFVKGVVKVRPLLNVQGSGASGR